jgi:hypothetical protein
MTMVTIVVVVVVVPIVAMVPMLSTDVGRGLWLCCVCSGSTEQRGCANCDRDD